MTKLEAALSNQALRTNNPSHIGRILSSLHRAALSNKSQRELAHLIETTPEVRATVTFDGSCYVATR